MSWSTRSAISTAAFSVNVGAITSSGRARLEEMRWAMRRVRTVVLPVPAPAMMSSGPSPWTTASCWADERPSRIRSAAVAVSVDMCGQYARRGRHARSVRLEGYASAISSPLDAEDLAHTDAGATVGNVERAVGADGNRRRRVEHDAGVHKLTVGAAMVRRVGRRRRDAEEDAGAGIRGRRPRVDLEDVEASIG